MVTDEGGYGRFGALSRVELERFFYLNDEDRRLIAARRRDCNRLGFALQVVTVRQLGMFLADPLDVPPELIDYLAEQLGIEDSSCVKQYTERENTKLEHAWEIQREYGLTPYADVESELAAWVADQAWMTGDGPKAMFAGAVEWLRTRQALAARERPVAREVPGPGGRDRRGGQARRRGAGAAAADGRAVPLRHDRVRLPDPPPRRRAPAGDSGVHCPAPFTDERTGEQIRYLFVRRGQLISNAYLFEEPLQKASKAVGLVGPGGWHGKERGTVTAHRFRHTAGTQLAERGAKLHTTMKVLGHSSVSMALVYAQVSDREVLRDYKSILAPGAVIAGPAAGELKSGTLPAETIDWLKANFLKTELELGHCLRLPAEGPCECDLYLTCAKFVTTGEYTPRLRARREVEQQLVQDADERGWTREVERHTAIARRLTDQLTDLGETTEPDHDPGREPRPCRSTETRS